MPGILWLLIGAAAAHHGQPADAAGGQWVEVTRPVIACSAAKDDPALQRRYLDASKRGAAGLPAGCQKLRVGQKLKTDPKQSASDKQVAERMWAPAVGKDSKPIMAAVYAPPRGSAGDYLRPTTPPKGAG